MDKQTQQSLRKAHLHYVSDHKPGFLRQKDGKAFKYVDTHGRPIRSAQIIKRIRKLALPPAYRDVWICPDPHGHLQAVGRDARGRKQYRYHADWIQFRDSHKYERMIDFAKSLPKIRRITDRHLKLAGLPREKVLATIVKLLEKTLIRVGNEEYARTNHSYGLTTLRNKHVSVHGAHIKFEFKGKSHVQHSIDLEDPKLARVVKACQDLPGFEIFQYINADGQRHDVHSEDVNAYLKEIGGEEFTAKDFRTWAGTLLAAKSLQEYKRFSSATEAKKQILTAIEKVSKRLGNTKAICRKCYVHPAVIESHMDGSLSKILEARATKILSKELRHLHPDEAAILVLLEKRLKKDSRKTKSDTRV